MVPPQTFWDRTVLCRTSRRPAAPHHRHRQPGHDMRRWQVGVWREIGRCEERWRRWCTCAIILALNAGQPVNPHLSLHASKNRRHRCELRRLLQPPLFTPVRVLGREHSHLSPSAPSPLCVEDHCLCLANLCCSIFNSDPKANCVDKF